MSKFSVFEVHQWDRSDRQCFCCGKQSTRNTGLLLQGEVDGVVGEVKFGCIWVCSQECANMWILQHC